MTDAMFFFRHFLKNPVQVSSAIPTSTAIARRLAEKLTKPGRKVVVEYGPGVGVLAKAILRSGNLSEDSKLILIEKTKAFVDRLRTKICDPRVIVVHDSAENVQKILQSCGEKKADYIFSSIPLSLMEPSRVDAILHATHRSLADDGSFIVFLFRFSVKELIRQKFPTILTRFELANLPPLFIFEATKKALRPKRPQP